VPAPVAAPWRALILLPISPNPQVNISNMMRKTETFVHRRSHVAEDVQVWTGLNVRVCASIGSGASIFSRVEIGEDCMVQNQADIRPAPCFRSSSNDCDNFRFFKALFPVEVPGWSVVVSSSL